jgi:hypothetical protein
MAEQERIVRRKLRSKSSRPTESATLPASGNTRQEEAGKKLSEVDAAFDDFLAAHQTAAGSVVAGQQQPQQVVKPLSDAEFVQGFRQHGGE